MEGLTKYPGNVRLREPVEHWRNAIGAIDP